MKTWLNTKYFIDNGEFNIIKSNFNNNDLCANIEILDNNYNLWFRFTLYDTYGCKLIKCTKQFIIIFHKYYESLIIKRRSIIDYEKLEKDY